MKFSPLNQIIEYHFDIRIFGQCSNIRLFGPIPVLNIEAKTCINSLRNEKF